RRPERLTLLGELRAAIDCGELTLHYQPKAELPSGAVTSVEALVRWQHPKRGLIPPTEFVPVAEATGLIEPLTHWVIDEALRQRLDAMGVRLSIDDFGTGYSSLAYLNQLPISQIKIDRMFVTGMLEDANKAVIVQSVIDLGRSLGLHVVAEGVETAEVWRRLVQLECAALQGYCLSPPLP